MKLEKIRYLHFLICWGIVGFLGAVAAGLCSFFNNQNAYKFISGPGEGLWLFSLLVGTVVFIIITAFEIYCWVRAWWLRS